jgi:hypothetical protein
MTTMLPMPPVERLRDSPLRIDVSLDGYRRSESERIEIAEHAKTRLLNECKTRAPHCRDCQHCELVSDRDEMRDVLRLALRCKINATVCPDELPPPVTVELGWRSEFVMIKEKKDSWKVYPTDDLASIRGRELTHVWIGEANDFDNRPYVPPKPVSKDVPKTNQDSW